MESLVVPAIGETMAFSSLKSALINEDLPTLGLPAMATGTPFLMTFP